jgi:hypothetical protein
MSAHPASGDSSPDAAGSAAAQFAISSAALDAAIDTVVVTVSQGDGPAFPSFQVPLSFAGTSWSGFTTGIPSGAGRQFDVVARDASGTPVLAGSARCDVPPAGVTYVAMLLQPTAASASYAADAPVIDLLTASSTVVPPGGSVRLAASAHDPAVGGGVSYRWSSSCQGDPTCQSAASCGSFDNALAPATAWTAPAFPDTCQLSLTVQDDRPVSVTVPLQVLVSTTAPPAA